MAEQWTIDELREVTALALDAVEYDGQTSGRVREIPDKRTIRYYTTLGLLDRPLEFRGRTALYGRRHVLQLAAIKRLQAKGMTLVQIQEALTSADDRRLARWAGTPSDFWERHRLTPAPPPDPDSLLRSETPRSEQTAPRPQAARRAAFWRHPTSGETAMPLPAATDDVASSPRPVAALSLAEGVTLLLEHAPLESLDDDRLAELAPAAEALVEKLRQLKLLP